MIDRNARDAAIALLKKILAEDITNYEFEDQWPDKSSEFVITAIAEQLWFYYDDYPKTKFMRAGLGPEVTSFIERAIVFLSSDVEYEWPEYSFATENRSLFERLFGLGKRRSTEQWEKFKAAGEIDAWPFLRIADYKHALEQRTDT